MSSAINNSADAANERPQLKFEKVIKCKQSNTTRIWHFDNPDPIYTNVKLYVHHQAFVNLGIIEAQLDLSKCSFDENELKSALVKITITHPNCKQVISKYAKYEGDKKYKEMLFQFEDGLMNGNQTCWYAHDCLPTITVEFRHLHSLKEASELPAQILFNQIETPPKDDDNVQRVLIKSSDGVVFYVHYAQVIYISPVLKAHYIWTNQNERAEDVGTESVLSDAELVDDVNQESEVRSIVDHSSIDGHLRVDYEADAVRQLLHYIYLQEMSVLSLSVADKVADLADFLQIDCARRVMGEMMYANTDYQEFDSLLLWLPVSARLNLCDGRLSKAIIKHLKVLSDKSNYSTKLTLFRCVQDAADKIDSCKAERLQMYFIYGLEE